VFKAIKIYYPEQYKDMGDEESGIWDIAMLELEFPAGEKYGWLGIDASYYKGDVKINISGYPGYTYFNAK
jgi:V8-like Glu-specific endopeptidase